MNNDSVDCKATGHLHIRKDPEGLITFSLCALLFIPGINNLINSLFSIGMSVNLSFLTPLSYIFMAFLSVFTLYKLIVRKRSFLFLFVFLLFGSVLSYVIYPDIRSVIYNSPVDLVYSPVNKLIFFCFPALMGTACIKNFGAFFDKLVKWGIVVLVLGILTFVYVYFIAGKVLQYMVYSYFMLLPICLVFEYAREKKSFWHSFLAVVGTLCIIMCGARGAIVSLFFYFVTRLLLVDFKNIGVKKLLKFFAFTLSAIMVLFFFYEEVLNLIIKLLDALGVNSRIVTALIEDTLTDDNGRASIVEAISEGLRSNPFGHGLYGDRYVVGAFGSRYTYAHNIILELMCDFGVILGGILFVILICRIGQIVFYLKNKPEIKIILALLPYGLFQLFFSSSMLENIPFFVLFGLCFFINWEKYHKERINTK